MGEKGMALGVSCSAPEQDSPCTDGKGSPLPTLITGGIRVRVNWETVRELPGFWRQ